MKLTKEQLIQNLINNKSYREASDELIQYIEQMDPENMEMEIMTFKKALLLTTATIKKDETLDTSQKEKYYQKNNNMRKVLDFFTKEPFINQFANQTLSDKYLNLFAKQVSQYFQKDFMQIHNKLSFPFSKVYFKINSYNEISKKILDFRVKYERELKSYTDADIKELNTNLKDYSELESLISILEDDVAIHPEAEKEYKQLKPYFENLLHNAQNNEDFKNNQFLKGKLAGEVSAEELNEFIHEQLFEVALKDDNSFNEFMETVATFRVKNYSVNNRLLLFVQCVKNDLSPALVACESEWESKGYKIPSSEKKNALQLLIYSPYSIFYEKNKDGQTVRSIRTNSIEEMEELRSRIPSGEIEEVRIGKIFPKNVMYSIDQIVDGKTLLPLEEKDKPDVLQRFNSKAEITEEIQTLIDKLEKFAIKLGLNLTVEKMNSALGYVSTDTVGKEFNKLAINNEIQDKEKRIWTLTHEIGHHLCKHYERGKGRSPAIPKEFQLSHQDEEVQAQLISHLVCSHYGIKQNLSFSASYIKGYSGDVENDNEAKERILGNIKITLPVAQGIVELLENSGNELDQESFNKISTIPINYLMIDKKTKTAKVVNEAYVNKAIKNGMVMQKEEEMEKE